MKHQQAASHHPQNKPAAKSATRAGVKAKNSPIPEAAHGDAEGNGHYEMIRETAYGFYVARGCVAGHELDDWLQAEAVVNETRAGSSRDLEPSSYS